MRTYRIISLIQLLYFLITAVWPFVHLESFLRATGPKTDIWLLKTVSVLLLPYCFLLLYLAIASKRSVIAIITVILCGLGLMSIDVWYYLHKVISAVYLIDGFMQLLFVIFWTFYLTNTRNK